jgi:caffeoyl-CoA O-methyltransferase
MQSAPYMKGLASQDPAVRYAAEHSLRLHPAQQEIVDETIKTGFANRMGSPDELQLLQNLVRCIGGKKTLDIGVFTGYSALTIALVLPEDGKVVACDITEEFLSIGRPAWKKAGVEHKIDFVKAPALDTLQKLLDKGEAGTYDFAFIDADKPSYDAYYEKCLKLLRPGGIIALDNMLWCGTVLDPQVQKPDTVVVRDLAKKIHADERVYVSFLTIGDGTVIVFKK